MTLYLIFTIFVIFIFLYFIYNSEEYFTNKDDRATDIINWFSNTPKSNYSYETFKKKVADSDVLEYLSAKQLVKKKSLTKDKLLPSL